MLVTSELIPILEEILYEFMDSKPEVCLIPSKIESCAKDGGMIRVATIQNPGWYKNMCLDFPRPGRGGKKKNPRTIIKRKETIRLIERLVKHKNSKSKYASYVTGEALRRFEIYSGNIEPWDNQF